MKRFCGFARFALLFFGFAWWSIPASAQLRLYAPNGGETIMSGSSFLIRWGGVNINDVIALEYTVDGGNSWDVIADSATGVSHLWNPVPALAGSQCLVRVFKRDAPTGGLLHLQPADNSRGGYVEFSPDETRVLTAAGNDVHMYNSLSGQELWKSQRDFVPTPNNSMGIKGAHFAIGGTRVVVWTVDDTLHLLDASNGAELARWMGGIPKAWQIPAFLDPEFYAAASPDGSKIAISGFEKIRVYDIAAQLLLHEFDSAATLSTIPYVSWSPDASMLAAANASNKNSTVRLINAVSGSVTSNFAGHPFVIRKIRFSNDGKTLAVISSSADSSSVDIWDIASTTRRGRLLSARYFQDVDFSPDDARFLTTDARTPPSVAQWWDSQTLAPLSTLGTRDFLGDIDVSRNGQRVLAGATTGAVIFQPPAIISEADTSDGWFTIRTPIADTSLIVSIDSLEANTNEEVFFRVRLQAGKGIDFTGVSKLQGSIGFNASLLEPIGATPKGLVVRQQRTIDWEFSVQGLSAPLDTTAAILQFRTGLGNDSTTSLAWSNVVAVPVAKAIESRNGFLRLVDICREGGDRLIFASPKTYLWARPPHQSEHSLFVTFRTNEYGLTNLRLYDLWGVEVSALVNEQLELGEHKRELALEALPTGVYFLVMTTPTERLTLQVRVLR